MRTGRALTVSRGGCACREGGVPAWRGGACLEGGCLPGGVPAWRGGACLEGGVPAWRGGCLPGWGVPAWMGGVPGACPPQKFGGPPPPVDRMTHACENITLAKTSFRPVKMFFCLYNYSLQHLHLKQIVPLLYGRKNFSVQQLYKNQLFLCSSQCTTVFFETITLETILFLCSLQLLRIEMSRRIMMNMHKKLILPREKEIW